MTYRICRTQPATPSPGTSVLLVAILCVGVWALTGSAIAADDQDTVQAQAFEDRLQELEAQIQALQQALAAAGSSDDAAAGLDLTELERRIEALSREIERLRIGDSSGEATESVHGLGPAASKVYHKSKGVSIGGYGEMLYQTYDSTRDDGSPSGKTDQLDLLRAVLYFGYRFNDRILFNS